MITYIRIASTTCHTDHIVIMPPERGPNCIARGLHVTMGVRNDSRTGGNAARRETAHAVRTSVTPPKRLLCHPYSARHFATEKLRKYTCHQERLTTGVNYVRPANVSPGPSFKCATFTQ